MLRLLRTSVVAATLVAAATSVSADPPTLSSAFVLPGNTAIDLAAGQQTAPCIARGGDRTLVVWADARSALSSSSDGYDQSGTDLFAVRLDANGLLMDETPIAIATTYGIQSKPLVSWNGSSWLIAWEGQTPTPSYLTYTLQARRMSPDGVLLDSQPLNVLSSPTSNTFPAFAVANNGSDWLVIGQGAGAGDGGIKGRRIAADGTFVDATPITLLAETYYLYFFVDLHAAGGEYLLTYQDNVGMKGRRFSASLAPIGSPFVVPGSRFADSDSGYFVTWVNGTNLVGSPMSVTGTLAYPAGKVIAAMSNIPWPGTAESAWDGTDWWTSWFHVVSYGEYRVRAAKIAANGTVVTPGGVDLGHDLTSFASGLRIDGDVNGGVRAVFSDEIGVSEAPLDIWSAALDADAMPTGAAAITTASPAERAADLITGPNGTRLVAWLSSHSGISRILCQRVSRYGAALDPVPLELTSGPSLSAPAVAWDGERYLVVWSNGLALSGCRVAEDGTLIDEVPLAIMPGFQPEVAGANGIFYAVCAHSPSYPQNRYIFGKRIDGATGAPLDAGALNIGGTFANYPDAIAVGDRWVVTWQSNYSHDNPQASAVASFVNANGTLGATVGLSAGGFVPKAAAAGDGTVLVAFNTNSPANANNDVVARRILADGSVGPTFTVSSAFGKQLHPSVAWNGNEFIVAWDDRRNQAAFYDYRTDVYAARVSAGGSLLDPTGFAVFNDTDARILGGLAGNDTGSVLAVASAFEPEQPWTSYRLTLAYIDPDSAADITGDGIVNGADLAALLGFWGSSNAAGDLNGDGTVDARDLAMLLAAWS
ncbi:MAG: dockerin type I repeat-containing protein [Phycisphaerae bacterium]|jgi:hypothetical protein|nr:dockerin type I repeat-containing protein [Phycisphaerae bacterium]